jgi:hypothetical protein
MLKNTCHKQIVGGWLAIGVVGVLFATTTPARAQSPTHYRDYELGSSVASISALVGMKVSDARIIHERPAVIQDLEWRRPLAFSDVATKDPVEQIVFSFYNDRLFKLVIEYDRHRTEGMTDADMVEAISVLYGARSQLPPKNGRAISLLVTDPGTRIAGWGDADYSAVLYRSSYAAGFRMIVTGTQLDSLARVADAQAVKLEERDAPKLAIAKQKKEDADLLAAQAKARVINKTAFRP